MIGKNESIRTAVYESPLGRIVIWADDEAVVAVKFEDESKVHPEPAAQRQHPLLRQAAAELDEYFRGTRRLFTLPLRLEGTDFQRLVLQHVSGVPYGSTASYRDIAALAGSERAVRAVGSANARNRLMIVVPCHRIIGANGAPTGYAGGLWRKTWLLEHERSPKS